MYEGALPVQTKDKKPCSHHHRSTQACSRPPTHTSALRLAEQAESRDGGLPPAAARRRSPGSGSLLNMWARKATRDKQYLNPHRLADVLGLIQVLALDEHSHRSEEGLQGELQGQPKSGNSWTEIARAHPEFFRVRPQGDHTVSLIARHVFPKNERGVRELPADFTGQLIATAVDLHDRQIKRSERWTYLVPIWVALITGIFVLGAIALKSAFGQN